jgi:4'-phosphopantetheinyl transferase EntD
LRPFENHRSCLAAELGEAGVLVECRLIAPGDELALLPEELKSFATSVARVKRASGAARIAGRSLLGQLGFDARAIPKDQWGAPIWPEQIVGSLAHDSDVAIAAVARRRSFLGIGVDVENAGPLEDELVSMVLTEKEHKTMSGDPVLARLVFAIKEAVYKATSPLDRVFLDHHDVEVDLDSRVALTRTGMTVHFRYGTLRDISTSRHIAALAWIPADR